MLVDPGSDWVKVEAGAVVVDTEETTRVLVLGAQYVQLEVGETLAARVEEEMILVIVVVRALVEVLCILAWKIITRKIWLTKYPF